MSEEYVNSQSGVVEIAGLSDLHKLLSEPNFQARLNLPGGTGLMLKVVDTQGFSTDSPRFRSHIDDGKYPIVYTGGVGFVLSAWVHLCVKDDSACAKNYHALVIPSDAVIAKSSGLLIPLSYEQDRRINLSLVDLASYMINKADAREQLHDTLRAVDIREDALDRMLRAMWYLFRR